jgi:hypothetical protein
MKYQGKEYKLITSERRFTVVKQCDTCAFGVIGDLGLFDGCNMERRALSLEWESKVSIKERWSRSACGKGKFYWVELHDKRVLKLER